MQRRHFLQFAGSSLAAVGLSQMGFSRQADSYGRALAQSTSRKLALLVGVNSYPDPQVSDLAGCLNDVEMQYQLLVHRFGFKPQDILKITDNEALKPNRANILQAFEEHLIKQAKPGDVVVFHYSGHGALVRDASPVAVQACANTVANTNGTLVPNDAIAPNQNGPDLIVPDIMGQSLFLLSERVQSDSLMMVLDSCFSGAGTRGNATVRSINSRLSRTAENCVATAAEYENQERWLRELNLTRAEFQQRRARGIAKGMAIGSASCDQLSFEMPFDTQHSAGTFTYLLTSYLWQTTAAEPAQTSQVNLVRSTRATVTQGSQVPVFEYAPNSQNEQKPLYFAPMVTPFAEGAVLYRSGQAVEFWLGGVSHANLDLASKGARYSLIDPAGSKLGTVVLERRAGLLGFGKLVEGQLGDDAASVLVREEVAVIADPTLKIGLDASLGSALAEAEAALAAVLPGLVVGLPLNQQSTVEYVLARTTEALQQQLGQAGETELPPVGSFALFTADLAQLLPGSFGSARETATAAVNRLRSRFRSLLVGKALRQLAGASSDLRISGEVFANEGEARVPLLSRGSQRDRTDVAITHLSSEPFRAGQTIQLKVQNQENADIYLSMLAIGSLGDVVVLHPANWDAPVEAARVRADEEMVVPRAADSVNFRVRGAGYVEIITIVSQQPLRGLLQSLQSVSRGANRSRGAVGFGEGDPLDLVSSLLRDVDGVSRGANASIETSIDDAAAVDSGAIAAFSTLIEVVE